MKKLASLVGRSSVVNRPGVSAPALRYGRVFFALRRELGLTSNEALLLDMVDTLGRRTGWCFASRKYLAGLLGVSERTLRRLVSGLCEKGLLERSPEDQRLLRVGQRWKRARQAVRVSGRR